jgi:DNA-binding response OmpR family regulator
MIIVVIEDEEDIRNLVLFNLRAEGFEVFGAAGAGEGLALCTMHRPDVVIVDRMLHGADGLDVVEQMRSDREIADAAIIVLSARGSVDDKLTGFDSGADDYVVKPFSVAELVVRVKKLAAIASMRRASLLESRA